MKRVSEMVRVVQCKCEPGFTGSIGKQKNILRDAEDKAGRILGIRDTQGQVSLFRMCDQVQEIPGTIAHAPSFPGAPCGTQRLHLCEFV